MSPCVTLLLSFKLVDKLVAQWICTIGGRIACETTDGANLHDNLCVFLLTIRRAQSRRLRTCLNINQHVCYTECLSFEPSLAPTLISHHPSVLRPNISASPCWRPSLRASTFLDGPTPGEPAWICLVNCPAGSWPAGLTHEAYIEMTQHHGRFHP